MALCTPGGRVGDTTLVLIGVYCKLQKPFFFSGSPRCIIKLGAPGFVHGLDIDTSHFNGVPSFSAVVTAFLECSTTGNEAPEASVEALFSEGEAPPTDSDGQVDKIICL